MMDFSAMSRAAAGWRDRRVVKKYADAAHVMDGAKHVDALLEQLKYNPRASRDVAIDAAKTFNTVPNKTSKRIDKLAANPELKAKVDKGLGLNTSNDIY
jgi:hypothetical protein